MMNKTCFIDSLRMKKNQSLLQDYVPDHNQSSSLEEIQAKTGGEGGVVKEAIWGYISAWQKIIN